MSEITFYRQRREDGGVRTGIEVGDLTVFEAFAHQGDDDPALTWWVDVRCTGATLPKTADGARQWLLQQAPLFANGLTRLAERLQAGMDFQYVPLQWKVPDTPVGVDVTVVCSAIRRIAAKEMGSVLAEIAQCWQEWIAKLPAIEAVSP